MPMFLDFMKMPKNANVGIAFSVQIENSIWLGLHFLGFFS